MLWRKSEFTDLPLTQSRISTCGRQVQSLIVANWIASFSCLPPISVPTSKCIFLIDMLAAIAKSPILRNADDGKTFHLIGKGLAMEISSTYIREEFQKEGEPRYLLPESCYQYIKTNHFYQ